jgi:hypothetical protein
MAYEPGNKTIAAFFLKKESPKPSQLGITHATLYFIAFFLQGILKLKNAIPNPNTDKEMAHLVLGFGVTWLPTYLLTKK